LISGDLALAVVAAAHYAPHSFAGRRTKTARRAASEGDRSGGASSIIVSRSTDGGVHWQTPVTAKLDTSFTVLNDKESVTADPGIASNAYAVWDRLVAPSTNANPDATLVSPAFRGPALFSRTTDSGMSWTPGRVIFDPGQNDQTLGNHIVVPTAGSANGNLIDGFDLITNTALGRLRQTNSVAIIRSKDLGNTWSGPTVVAQEHVAHVSINGRLRTSDELPEFATGPEGNLYAVWQDGRFSSSGHAKIAFSMSTNGGASWSTPVRIDGSSGDVPAFTPQVTVDSSGTVAVQYYDLGNATAAEPGLTDQFLVTCNASSSNCASSLSWSTETRLSTSGSFNILTAPKTVSGAGFVGDYDGLVPGSSTFDSAFVMAQPIATAGLTDLFFNTAP
jgi:hypothetical protein